MTQPLTFEEWKEKYIKVNDGFVESLKKSYNLTDEQIESELDFLHRQSYETYVMQLTNPEEFEQWKKEHFNEELGVYDIKL